MNKTVQIPLELFLDLVNVHLIGCDDKVVLKRIVGGLESKLNAMALHELYTASKTAKTEKEKEKARQQYLEKIGIQNNFKYSEVRNNDNNKKYN